MSAYSIPGYIIALKNRSKRTLLVEGKDDKQAISRVLREIESRATSPIPDTLIDSADLIQGGGVVASNRELVELIHAQATAATIPVGVLVDREYREFDTTVPVVDNLSNHRVIGPDMFWTRGHSLENYFLDADYTIHFLKLQFPEIVNIAILNAVEAHFDSMLRDAAVASLAGHLAQLLSRCIGISKANHWSMNSSGLVLSDQALSQDFVLRGATSAQASLFTTKFPIYRIGLHDKLPLCRWVAHGHFGRELVWAGVAKIAEVAGCTRADVEQIASGYKEAKFRHDVDLWTSKIFANQTDSPEALWQWLGKTPMEIVETDV